MINNPRCGLFLVIWG
uniref:Uncharacterized protein n=1 Tax=Anguilla anguilla TaxID=7936 RepID=A0A0E9TPH4_ANGAN